MTTYATGRLAAFCGLGAVACFSQASHPVAIRIIGGTVFLVCLGYLASQALDNSPPPAAARAGQPAAAAPLRRGRPSLINSLMFFALVGLPSGYAALRGRYPSWGRHAAAFGEPRR